MKGIEISRAFYNEYGKNMLESEFKEIMTCIAVGLCGSGSECYGYDDEISKDHDFEPGFCIFIPGEDVIDRRTAFLLERAYSKLPKEFYGLKRSQINPVGGSRHGVIRRGEFFSDKVGSEDGILTVDQWLKLPQYALCEATNGEIFYDGDGAFTKIRSYLMNMPEDIRKKRLAGALLMMAQSGQYNYMRCISHNETAAAQLAVFEFVKYTLETVFLLNNAYMPYYKWSFRAMRDLKKFAEFAETLEFLMTTENGKELSETKYYIIEDIASAIIEELRERDLSGAICGDLEKHAYSVNDSITDPEIRNLNIFYTV